VRVSWVRGKDPRTLLVTPSPHRSACAAAATQPSLSVASPRRYGCQLESLLVVHLPSLVLQP